MSAIEHAPAGTIRVEAQETRTVIVFVGEVDAALRAEASASMGAALVTGLPVVVDSSRATFVDSSGLAFVLQLHLATSEAGIPLTLHDPHRVMRDVLDMVGLGAELEDEVASPSSGDVTDVHTLPDDVPVG
ncbi:STAS domain-containing protein [Cellulomonas alba]|uniref:STAS domain-containing protein n=1 Tax=Cellulomonas alba TaxID=3053467 RepID=A0ABT7SG19_9CELL|nr:STAS domain-containing protein [Cellulomonas alba]MDM7855131.1 STAS domain-containing protein [Cellulomonas alba]